jgi:integrase
MPRRRSPPRLYLDPGRRQWAIRDASLFVRLGLAENQQAAAEKELSRYLAAKYEPPRSNDPLICDTLALYAKEHAPHTATAARSIAYHIKHLGEWWGTKPVSDVTAVTCREYARATGSASYARCCLETLGAAVRYYSKAKRIPLQVDIWLPPRPEPRARWLTRSEVARLLWAARRHEHLKRFILIGVYTGSRSKNILGLRWDQVDLVAGTMRRRPYGVSESKTKRAPPVRLGRRILAHLRRWRRLDDPRSPLVCHYNGRAIKRSFYGTWPQAIAKAGLAGTGVTPHVLRHTRATWALQRGIDPWQVAGHLGMTIGMLTRTYGHHAPDWQRDVAEV